MRNFFVFIVVALLTIGCSHDEYRDEKKIYNNFIRELQNVTEDNFQNVIPLDINVSFEQIDESEITYYVVIDNPRVIMRNIRALVIHNYGGSEEFPLREMFPSSGIFEEQLSLIPDVINLSSNYVGGIILAGYIPFNEMLEKEKGEFLVIIEYEDESSKLNKLFYRYQK